MTFLLGRTAAFNMVNNAFPLIEIIQAWTAQSDLGLISRTFSLKNKFPSFSEISQGWQCLKIVYMVR